MTQKVVNLKFAPGIQRDGTRFASLSCVDGKWVRFQYGRPRKMGGYRGSFLNASGVSRGMIMQSQNGLNYVISGYSGGIEQWTTDNDDGVGFGPTPISLTGYTASAQTLWQFDIGYDAYGTGQNNLIAHPGQNLNDISSTTNTRPLIGQFTGGSMAPVNYGLTGRLGTNVG